MSFITEDQLEQLALSWFQGMSILRLGAEMLPLKSNRPRCFHRGLQPTGNPQSRKLWANYGRKYSVFQGPAVRGECGMTEDDLEQLTLTWFQDARWEYRHGPDIAPDGDTPEHHRLWGTTTKLGDSGE